MIEEYSNIIVQSVLDRGEIKSTDWENVDLEKLLVQASHNRVLYAFVNKLWDLRELLPEQYIHTLEDVRKEGERNLKALRNTLLLLEETFKRENIDYLIVKTFKYLDYVTFDVDFLVRYQDFQKAIEILKKNNIIIKPHPNPKTQGLHQRNCFKSGYLKMDLHRKFFWLGVDHVDSDFLWKDTTCRDIAGIKCPVPSLEVDFLLHNKQLVYERRYITLLDFLAVKWANDEGLNWNDIAKQVVEHRWDDTFFVLLNWLNYLHREIFHENMVDPDKHFYNKKYTINERQLRLPFHYPVKDVMKVFSEIVTKNKHLPSREFAYYFFTTGRYLATHRLPFYDHWYDFNKINKRKYKIGKCIN
ncbi:MAG: nucleotidyltransferase family protein [Candidatus Aceula meridiana]|nr:nucleotidyltransferase family protein [Candidatus Aceula meridiana]